MFLQHEAPLKMAVRMQYETWVAGRKLYHLVLARDFLLPRQLLHVAKRCD